MSLPVPASAIHNFSDETCCHTAYFASQPNGSGVLVTARGEIDSVNSESFATFTLERATADGQLKVDLSQITFFGVDGVWALRTINNGCLARGTDWSLTAGRAVARVLRICDPMGILPVTVGAPAGSASLQLVAQPTQSPGQ